MVRVTPRRPAEAARHEPAPHQSIVDSASRWPAPSAIVPVAAATAAAADPVALLDPGALVDPGAAAPLDLAGHARQIEALLPLGRLDAVDAHMGAHALLAQTAGTAADRRDAVAWATMRALLDGRRDDARVGADLVLQLGQEAGDPEARRRYWMLRFRVMLEWGDKGERDDLIDHCREEAYRYDDVAWRGALTLLLARLGRLEEAANDFDSTALRCLAAAPRGRRRGTERPPAARHPAWLDIVTDLAEAAAILADARRAEIAHRAMSAHTAPLVVVGSGEVCKGSIARFRALTAGAMGRWDECDREFRLAADLHRDLGAQPLLARTLHDWARSRRGRDDAAARRCSDEALSLARRYDLTGLNMPGGEADVSASAA